MHDVFNERRVETGCHNEIDADYTIDFRIKIPNLVRIERKVKAYIENTSFMH